jgi:cell division protein FtsB
MRRLLAIGFAAFALASLAIFFFGDSGLSAFRGLSQYASRLSENVDALKQRNQELEARLQKLRTDRDSIVVLARDVGLYEPGDVVVKLVGRPSPSQNYAMGDLLRKRKTDAGRNASFKETAIGAAFVFVLAAFLVTRLSRRKADGARRR